MIHRYLFGFMLVCAGLCAAVNVEYVGFDGSELPTQLSDELGKCIKQFKSPLELTAKTIIPNLIKESNDAKDIPSDAWSGIHAAAYPALKITDEVICAQLSHELRLAPTIIEDTGTGSQKMTLAYYNFLVSGFNDDKKLTVHRVEEIFVPDASPLSDQVKYKRYNLFIKIYTMIFNQLIENKSARFWCHPLLEMYLQAMDLRHEMSCSKEGKCFCISTLSRFSENLPVEQQQDMQEAIDAFNCLDPVNGDTTTNILCLNTICKMLRKFMEPYCVRDLDGKTIIICDNALEAASLGGLN